MTVTMPLSGTICHPSAGSAMMNMHTKFEVSSLSRPLPDILGD